MQTLRRGDRAVYRKYLGPEALGLVILGRYWGSVLREAFGVKVPKFKFHLIETNNLESYKL